MLPINHAMIDERRKMFVTFVTRYVKNLPELKGVYPKFPKISEGQNIMVSLTCTGDPVKDLVIGYIITVVARKGSWGPIPGEDFLKVSQDGLLKLNDTGLIINALGMLQKDRLVDLVLSAVDGLTYILPSVELAEMAYKSNWYII
jgi:hypothetical protein